MLRSLCLRLTALLALAASALADAGLRVAAGRKLKDSGDDKDGLSPGTYVAIGVTSTMVVIPCCFGLYSYVKYKWEKYKFKNHKDYEVEQFSGVVVGDQFKTKGQMVFQ